MRSSDGRNAAKSDASRAFTHISYDSAAAFANSTASSAGTRRARFQSRCATRTSAGVVGIVGKGGGVRLELHEQLAEPVVDDVCVVISSSVPS